MAKKIRIKAHTREDQAVRVAAHTRGLPSSPDVPLTEEEEWIVFSLASAISDGGVGTTRTFYPDDEEWDAIPAVVEAGLATVEEEEFRGDSPLWIELYLTEKGARHALGE